MQSAVDPTVLFWRPGRWLTELYPAVGREEMERVVCVEVLREHAVADGMTMDHGNGDHTAQSAVQLEIDAGLVANRARSLGMFEQRLHS